ncbi:unnamed protein product [Tilletia caries]|uniref:Major facilitator superfamily (MFS) profile domain-containing protein n=1 Tax=Tilletia caries TaxID=13290 RepID=A0ABN7J2R5_9BASI|nr:unnamed protein product [Tilletia caries]CAD6948560.1 unnamed protein product [Tilletia caries]
MVFLAGLRTAVGPTFGLIFGVQATWITLTALPLYMVNAIPAAAQPALGARDAIGLGLWLAAFLMEVVADNQKGAWRKEKDEGKHQEAFISRDLWSLSRHPNLSRADEATRPSCASTASMMTSAAIASTMGTARGTTQGS